jgi:hypothetical protein
VRCVGTAGAAQDASNEEAALARVDSAIRELMTAAAAWLAGVRPGLDEMAQDVQNCDQDALGRLRTAVQNVLEPFPDVAAAPLASPTPNDAAAALASVHHAKRGTEALQPILTAIADDADTAAGLLRTGHAQQSEELDKAAAALREAAGSSLGEPGSKSAQALHELLGAARQVLAQLPKQYATGPLLKHGSLVAATRPARQQEGSEPFATACLGLLLTAKRCAASSTACH